MVLEKLRAPLVERDLPTPTPGESELLVRVTACGVCRTDLHVVDGDLQEPSLPLVVGHEVVGVVEAVGADVNGFRPGERVGVPWLGGTCARCAYCLSDRENLCDRPAFTGYTRDGGYAEYMMADCRYCFAIPDGLTDVEAAPLLCAGLIGWRSYKVALGMGPGGQAAFREKLKLGLYGFGAAAHIVAQIAAHHGHSVFAFTRPGDEKASKFALTLGAVFAGGSDRPAPEPLDAAIIFAPAGELVPAALAAVGKGGQVVCGGIHMSDIPQFPYRLLWGERRISSVANLTRQDGEELLKLAPSVPIKTTTVPYELARANEALSDLREGRLTGAAVLVPGA